MAIDPTKITSEKFREILVTDVDYRFDFGERESLTLREGDIIDRVSEPGWLIVTLQPSGLVEGMFPEVFRYRESKIIWERHQIRLMKVPVSTPTGQGPVSDPDLPETPTVSPDAPSGPGSPDSATSPFAGTASPEGPGDSIPSESPAPPRPQPRRKTARRSTTGG